MSSAEDSAALQQTLRLFTSADDVFHKVKNARDVTRVPRNT
jgi:hypothetical protein